MQYGSVFSGVGGFDIGFDRAGMRCAWQIEKDNKCQSVLARHWPDVERYGDIKTALPGYADVIAGGDPCPSHSKARSIWGSKHPDLSGYFLALVARLRPGWVVRENVPSPSAVNFSAALDAIGYGSVIVEIDAAGVTGQSRLRQFVIGCNQETLHSFVVVLSQREDVAWFNAPRAPSLTVAACLTTHPCRYDSRDNFIWEPPAKLRIMDCDERERLAGFPQGWTSGFSQTARAKFYGNAVVPHITEWIGRRIMEATK